MQEASSSHIGLKPAVVMRKQQDNEVAARETVSVDEIMSIALAAQVSASQARKNYFPRLAGLGQTG
jgi:hypothetical protein